MQIGQTLLQIPKKIEQFMKSEEIQTRRTLLKQLNQFRKNPQSLIPFLKRRKQFYSLQQSRLILFSPHHPYKGLNTQQGASIISQIMGQLYARDKMSPVIQNQYLTLIAQQIALSFKTTKNLNEIKITQNTAKQLRNELNNCEEFDFVDNITCLIGTGFDKDQFQPLLSLLIDDGNKQRKNRHLLFNQNFRFVGLGTTQIDLKPELRIAVYLFTTNIKKK